MCPLGLKSSLISTVRDTSTALCLSTLSLSFSLSLSLSLSIACYYEQITEEQKLIRELDGKIKSSEESINKQRRNMGG